MQDRLTSRLVIFDSASAAVRKTSLEIVRARVSIAAKPMAGNTYALLACKYVSTLQILTEASPSSPQ
jgi:hypothetical protein